MSEIIESASSPHSAFKVLAITVTAEIGAIVMCFVAGDKADVLLEDENFVYAALAAFAVGFLIVFTIFRMFEHNWCRPAPSISPSPGILSGSTARRHSGSIWIWFISTAAGVLNILLFFVLLKLN